MNPHRVRKPIDEYDETPTKYPSQFPPNSDGRTPYVLIVGAGIGGLFLAMLLEKAGIKYEIFERAPEVKALGSIMGINANILPVLEQLGIYEEFEKIAYPCQDVHLRYGNMKKIAEVSTENSRDLVGYEYLMLPRPEMYQFFLSKIPEGKIHFNKKVLSIMQNKDGAMIRCADGTTYHCDILVGADGAYSGVRQSLYKQLQERGLLPPEDAKELHRGFTCLVGTTDPLDPKRFPDLNKKSSDCVSVVGQGTSYSWTTFTVPGNRICYVVIRQFETAQECEDEKFRNSEWGPERSSSMIEAVRDFKLPYGTIGDLIDNTPRDKISRVYLEDKLFETWTHGRTVLIGDAAHKMLPSGGQGAVCAMQDAVVLTNCLYDLEDLTQASVEAALKDYREQRYDHVRVSIDNSNSKTLFLNGQTLKEKCIRYIVFHWLPQSMKDKALLKDAKYRPQLNFIPLAPKRGTGPVLPQKPSRRYEEEQRLKEEGVENKTGETVKREE
ncbi:hypothetical protein BGZ83_000498 [Gryganskiella cystojenkinii]|nr:hypothetical protein BGZ83_000498 [Gryganskiella cystojenkinii]